MRIFLSWYCTSVFNAYTVYCRVAKESLKGDYSAVRKGDCIVAFSKKDLFAIKAEIEKLTKLKCAGMHVLIYYIDYCSASVVLMYTVVCIIIVHSDIWTIAI